MNKCIYLAEYPIFGTFITMNKEILVPCDCQKFIEYFDVSFL